MRAERAEKAKMAETHMNLFAVLAFPAFRSLPLNVRLPRPFSLYVATWNGCGKLL
jgi:hypothetical protein